MPTLRLDDTEAGGSRTWDQRAQRWEPGERIPRGHATLEVVGVRAADEPVTPAVKPT
jgi:hypothetical protein